MSKNELVVHVMQVSSAGSRDEFIASSANDPILLSMFDRVMDGRMSHGETGWNPDMVDYATRMLKLGPNVMNAVLMQSAEIAHTQRQERPAYGEA